MDVLSEVLCVVKLEGATFYNAEFSAPLGFISPPAVELCPYVGSDSRHLIIYHLLLEGRAQAQVKDGPGLDLSPGDLVVFPHGDSHIFKNGTPAEMQDNAEIMGGIMALKSPVKTVRVGGGGHISKFVCGYMSCDRELSKMLLVGLPPIFKINIRNDAAGKWLENSIRFSANEGSDLSGCSVVLTKLAEALFVETVRRYMSEAPETSSGWLAGARDPEVGAALGFLHREPTRAWTVAELAREVGVSRAVLAERFRRFLGDPPITYLNRWRLRLGANLLETTSRSVLQVATEVGYESEAAFNRAFKREFGSPPARFRGAAKAARASGS